VIDAFCCSLVLKEDWLIVLFDSASDCVVDARAAHAGDDCAELNAVLRC